VRIVSVYQGDGAFRSIFR